MKIVILVSGGNVQGVYHTDLTGIEVTVIDFDNMTASLGFRSDDVNSVTEREIKGLVSATIITP